MLTASKLEKIMELEASLRAEYQQQLDTKTAEIGRLSARESELQAAVDKQLETITELTGKATDSQKAEQRARELHNRSERLVAEIAELKQRIKALQKDLAAVREENKTLTQYDPVRMKKNLDASKKKLAEKTSAADLLQKTLSETKKENAELQRKVAELEAKVAELAPEEAESAEAKEESAAA
jgi:chromosome segregation ATPase